MDVLYLLAMCLFFVVSAQLVRAFESLRRRP
jgi:hypothetical protein